MYTKSMTCSHCGAMCRKNCPSCNQDAFCDTKECQMAKEQVHDEICAGMTSDQDKIDHLHYEWMEESQGDVGIGEDELPESEQEQLAMAKSLLYDLDALHQDLQQEPVSDVLAYAQDELDHIMELQADTGTKMDGDETYVALQRDILDNIESAIPYPATTLFEKIDPFFQSQLCNILIGKRKRLRLRKKYKRAKLKRGRDRARRQRGRAEAKRDRAAALEKERSQTSKLRVFKRRRLRKEAKKQTGKAAILDESAKRREAKNSALSREKGVAPARPPIRSLIQEDFEQPHHLAALLLDVLKDEQENGIQISSNVLDDLIASYNPETHEWSHQAINYILVQGRLYRGRLYARFAIKPWRQKILRKLRAGQYTQEQLDDILAVAQNMLRARGTTKQFKEDMEEIVQLAEDQSR